MLAAKENEHDEINQQSSHFRDNTRRFNGQELVCESSSSCAVVLSTRLFKHQQAPLQKQAQRLLEYLAELLVIHKLKQEESLTCVCHQRAFLKRFRISKTTQRNNDKKRYLLIRDPTL